MFIAIVPAYNEEKNIGSVVRSLFSHVHKVVVVDDGSKDDTEKYAKEAGAVVLRHKVNRGQGAALQTGHDYAKQLDPDFVLHFDGDAQFLVEDIIPAKEELEKTGADILFGSRFLGKKSNIPFLKRFFLFPLAGLVNKVFVGLNLTDIHNGFRIFNRKALGKIQITQDRMAHASEIPAQAKKLGLEYIEFPVKVVYREYGQGLKGGVEIVKDLFLGWFLRRK